jgi:shikimate 5-dehydrogenase
MASFTSQSVPTMYFFGVTTGQSASRKMFPAWAAILGLNEAQLVGVDLPIDAPAAQYRQAVGQIKADPLSLGALVTTHKLNVLQAARDYFDELTADANLCREVSCIYKENGRLIGHASDPTTSGQAMQHFIPTDYWARHQADILCLGAGGAAVALVTYFCTRTAKGQRPRRMILVDRAQARLDNLDNLIRRLPETGIAFELVQNSAPVFNDDLMANLPLYSMVINATGMGKDTPGSPVTEDGRFPHHGIVWELNYRGERSFFHQAQAQAAWRHLQVEDGWLYFLLGWKDVVSHVFDLAIDEATFQKLAQTARRCQF